MNEIVKSDAPITFMELIAQNINNPNFDTGKLNALIDANERVKKIQAEIDFNEAMARIALKLADVRIVKRKSVGYDIDKNDKSKGKAEAFRYTPLEEIDKVVRQPLIEEGMSISYTTITREGGGAVVVARITHRAGHFREASIPLPLDSSGGKTNIQGMGSTFSYGRRYTLCMLLNIITLDDDDGTGGCIDDAQARYIKELIQASGADTKAFLKYMKAACVEEILFKEYRKATSGLEQKIKEKAKNEIA